jgi:hypothetical protein
MIFSEADMSAKSYRVTDLTKVELKIQDTLDATYKDLMYLTNYYDFDDEVLITAAAMMATFNFNREFSDRKLLSESKILYPQNFELKNFNYDAFMRLMLINTTGEPLMSDKDLYTRILDKTSFFTGILLLMCDILAVVIIPTAKVVVLLLLLFLSIAISVSSVLTPPERLSRVLLKHLGLPSLIFLVSSIGFAFVISLFMGEGLTGYVGSRTPSVGVTDPTITMGLMVVVNCIYLFLLWKVFILLVSSIKSHITSSFFSAISVAALGATQITGNTLKGTAKALGKPFEWGFKGGESLHKRSKEKEEFNRAFGSSEGSSDNSSKDTIRPPKTQSNGKDEVSNDKRNQSLASKIESLAANGKNPVSDMNSSLDGKVNYIGGKLMELRRNIEKVEKGQIKTVKSLDKYTKEQKKVLKAYRNKR